MVDESVPRRRHDPPSLDLHEQSTTRLANEYQEGFLPVSSVSCLSPPVKRLTYR